MMEYVTLGDGRRLYYRQAGSGEVLVMLHGWSMSSAVFQETLAGMARNFRVLVPDLTGHGATETSTVHLNLDILADDIEAWLELLDVDRVCLLGWSLGGQVALQMAKRRRLTIEKLVLVATTPLFVATADWPNGLPPTQVRAMDRQMQRHYEQSMGEFFRLMFDGEELSRDRYREIIDFAVRDGSLPTLEISRAGLKVLGASDLRPVLAEISVPTLVHYGSLDLITLPAACRYLAENIPKSCQVVWDDVGHAPFLSRPDASVTLWTDFLL